MSRYYWCYPEFENVEVGDEFIIVNYARWSDTTYSKVVKCVRATEQQFAVENPYDNEGKPIRFTKKGSEVGGNRSIKPATPEFKKEVAAIQRKAKNEKNRKQAEADAREQELRESYDAEWIHDKAIQKILSALRGIAEAGQKELDDFFNEDGVVAKASAEEPWPVLNYLDWNGEDKLRKATYFRDMATDLHATMVKICRHWRRGQSFTQEMSGGIKKTFLPGFGHEELVGADALVVTQLSNTINDLSNRIMDSYDEPKSWEREYLKELKEISGSRYAYNRLTLDIPKDEEEAA